MYIFSYVSYFIDFLFRYAENAKKISFSFTNRPMTPLNTALWWIEHVLATDGFELAKSNAMNMSWFTYHSVDVILVLFGGILLLLAVIIFSIKKICCTTRRTGKRKEKKN